MDSNSQLKNKCANSSRGINVQSINLALHFIKNSNRNNAMTRTISFAFLLTCLTISACKHEIDIAGMPYLDDTPLPIPCPDSLEDIDGNVYQVIDVDGTCWTTRNLTVSRFNNGDNIPVVTEGQDWIQLNTPAQC